MLRWSSASAAVRPPMPAPATITLRRVAHAISKSRRTPALLYNSKFDYTICNTECRAGGRAHLLRSAPERRRDFMESFESQISFSTRDLRIGDLLARNDKLRPNEIALIQDDRIVSWRELASGASRIASGFERVGCRKGSRVATIVKNDAFAIELLFTLALAGFVGIPINFGLTAEEVAVLLRDSVPDSIIVDADLAVRFSEILATTTASIFARGFQELPSGWRDIEDVRALGSSDFASPAHPDDIRTIRYTSGTTAAPKGCLGTHRQILASIGYFLRQVPIPGDGPFLQLLPLFSGAGI